METQKTKEQSKTVINTSELLEHWQGHRGLTRKVIEAFPEKEFFEYSIGGMRTFSKMVQELLDISAPGIRQMAGVKQLKSIRGMLNKLSVKLRS